MHKIAFTYHHCHISEGKNNILPFPLKPISVEVPLQQWLLDFIGEINPISSSQHKWIMIATY